jgi:hypothetical protein
MMNNVFCNVTNAAMWLSVGNYAGGGPATLINNSVVNAGSGVIVQDPWDATVRDCIFAGCTNATVRSGSLSLNVRYNDYFNNAVNFAGYPANYGQIIWNNRNGTPADLFYNIFQDPLFVSTSDFHLQTNSPCIDAGMPDWAYTDMCFTNGVSQGTSFPDLGAYGGPDACNWLDDVPLLPVQASMSQSNNVVLLSWGAIPRSTYQVQSVTNKINALPQINNWSNFPNGYITAADKPVLINVPASAGVTQRFFRVQSLGRLPGN